VFDRDVIKALTSLPFIITFAEDEPKPCPTIFRVCF
jgi:hypothetical protein